MFVLYTGYKKIVNYYDTRKEAEDFVWEQVNIKPRVSLDENELRHYANYKFRLVDEPMDNILEDFKYTLKSLGMLSMCMPNFNRNGDASYFRNLKEELNASANRVTGHDCYEEWHQGEVGGMTSVAIYAGEPVAFRRSNWDDLVNSPDNIVFKGLAPISEERTYFLQQVARMY